MKAKDKQRLGTIRLAIADIKRQEVDNQIDSEDDAVVLAIIDKMVKQRRDSLDQYEKAEREDLAAVERAEIEVLTEYLPKQLTDAEIDALIDEALANSDAQGMQAMGGVMAQLKPQVQGRADMKLVSARVRDRLAG